jgi:hypothetical protein
MANEAVNKARISTQRQRIHPPSEDHPRDSKRAERRTTIGSNPPASAAASINAAAPPPMAKEINQ